MARKLIYILLVQSFIFEVFSSYAQPTIQQYLHLTGLPNIGHTVAIPVSHTAASNQPLPTNQPTSNCATNQQRPTTGLPSFSALALPNLISALQQRNLPVQQKSIEIKSADPSSIDSNLLNNLAIALQLLIVSNILNAPPTDSPAENVKPKEIQPSFDTNTHQYYSQYESPMPNSNFVGGSNFPQPNLAQNYKPTKNSMTLMSPYEALSSSSPYSEPVSQYGSLNPRKDFQSPYAMMDNDLFGMNDLF